MLEDQVGEPMSVRLYVPKVLQDVPRVRAVIDAVRQVRSMSPDTSWRARGPDIDQG